MKKQVFALIVFFVLNLLLIGLVFGAEKSISVSVDVVENSSNFPPGSPENVQVNSEELGSFKGSPELNFSSTQEAIQRIFSEGINKESIAFEVDNFSIIFIFSFIIVFLLAVYIFLLISKIKRVIKKKKPSKKKTRKN